MTLRTEVIHGEPDRDEPDSWRLRVRVADDAQPELVALYLLRGALRNWTLIGLAIEPAHPFPTRELTVTEIRDMPLRQWERVAKEKADRELYQRMVRALRTESGNDPATGKPPELDDLLGEAPLLRRVAQEYTRWVQAGVKSPIGEMAREHNVERATVRQWLYRARRAGQLPGASGQTRQTEAG